MGLWLIWSQVILIALLTTRASLQKERIEFESTLSVSPTSAKMGSTASTILPVAPEAPKRTATTPRTTNAPPTAVISERGIAFFEQAFVEDTQAALAQTVLSKTDFAAALASRHPIRDQQSAFWSLEPGSKASVLLRRLAIRAGSTF